MGEHPLSMIIAQLPQFQPWWHDYQQQERYDPTRHRWHLSEFCHLLLDSAHDGAIPDFQNIAAAIEQALLATLLETPGPGAFADDRYDEIGLSITEQLVWAVEDGLLDGPRIYAALGEHGRAQWQSLWKYSKGESWPDATA
jgi:hypothetical protein